MRNTTSVFTLLDNVSAATSSTAFRVTDHKIVTIKVTSAGNADLDLFITGDISNDLNPPSTITPKIGVYDYDTALLITGATGIQVNGADIERVYNLNVDGLDWIQFSVDNYVAGSVTVEVKMFNND